jgi:hypothetical protein
MTTPLSQPHLATQALSFYSPGSFSAFRLKLIKNQRDRNEGSTTELATKRHKKHRRLKKD